LNREVEIPWLVRWGDALIDAMYELAAGSPGLERVVYSLELQVPRTNYDILMMVVPGRGLGQLADEAIEIAGPSARFFGKDGNRPSIEKMLARAERNARRVNWPTKPGQWLRDIKFPEDVVEDFKKAHLGDYVHPRKSYLPTATDIDRLIISLKTTEPLPPKGGRV